MTVNPVVRDESDERKQQTFRELDNPDGVNLTNTQCHDADTFFTEHGNTALLTNA